MKSIDAKAFSLCSLLASVNGKNSGITKIPAAAFYGKKKLTSVSFGKVTTVDKNAFKGCTALKSVSLGASLGTVGASAFEGCTALKSVALGSSLKTVGASAFKGCKALTSITLPKTVKSIGSQALYGCKACKTMVVKSSSLLASKIGAKAFTGTPAKVTVKVPKSKIKSYKKLFVKKGLSKKASFKKC